MDVVYLEIELEQINAILRDKFNLTIEVVSQEEEAELTAKGCYQNIDYDGSLCVFIGGGGSIELIFVQNKEMVGHKFYNFGVVDITSKFLELKEDIPTVSFDEVTEYVNSLIGDLEYKADAIVLAGEIIYIGFIMLYIRWITILYIKVIGKNI